MAERGRTFAGTVNVVGPPAEVLRAAWNALAGQRNVTLAKVSERTFVATREFQPTAAIVLGFLMLPIGLFILLAKDRESLSLTVDGDEGRGWRVLINGVADEAMIARLRAVLVEGSLGELAARSGTCPSGHVMGAGNFCPQCGEARREPDASRSAGAT